MDDAKFFAAVRTSLFGGALDQDQVDGCNVLLGEGKRRQVPTNHLAYNLATAFHETAHTLQPITELGGRSYFSKYEPGTKIGKALGNILPGDGYLYRGRGYVQITGRRNYALAKKKTGFDLVNKPDLALQPNVAVAVLFDGMAEGWFTGRDLSDFIDEFDEDDAEDLKEFVAARRIVNGTDKAELIAGYAITFEHALREAGYGAEAQVAADPGAGGAVQPSLSDLAASVADHERRIAALEKADSL